MATTIFSAPDIACQGCANAIKNALGSVSGVGDVQVDIENKTVTLRREEAVAPVAAVTSALDRAGFPASVVTDAA